MARRIRNSDADQNVFTPWRYMLCKAKRAGYTSGIKRAYRRAERRAGKRAIREED